MFIWLASHIADIVIIAVILTAVYIWQTVIVIKKAFNIQKTAFSFELSVIGSCFDDPGRSLAGT